MTHVVLCVLTLATAWQFRLTANERHILVQAEEPSTLDMIHWLPQEADVVFGIHGPIEADPTQKAFNLIESLALPPLGSDVNEHLRQAVLGLQGIMLFTWTSPPEQEEPMNLFAIAAYEHEAKDLLDEKLSALKEHAVSAKQIGGYEVFQIDLNIIKQSDPVFKTLYMTRPSDTVVAYSYTEHGIEQLISRIGGREPSIHTRMTGLIAEVLQTRPSAWGIRSFQPPSKQVDAFSPTNTDTGEASIRDLNAIGECFWIESNAGEKLKRLTIRYLSTNKDRETIARNRWKRIELIAGELNIQSLDPELVQCTVELDATQPPDKMDPSSAFHAALLTLLSYYRIYIVI